nr:hypothetical protein [uncultured Sulfurimonas sp.]
MKKTFSLSLCLASLLIGATAVQGSSKYESIKLGDFSVGGAVRVNFIQDSSSSDTKNASKDESGVFDLDVARINIDYKHDSYLGKFEYRWYPGFGNTQNGTNYSFIHTAWLGYAFDDKSQIQVGINRVPFGPTAYGISQSWFFDQHYYVGLSDDMDVGVKYTSSYESIKYDLAYYPQSEPEGIGAGGESARYAYDVVDDFHEKNQLNARMIYTANIGGYEQDFGFSLLYSQLESQLSGVDDGSRFAASAHMINRFGNFTLATQLTRYEMSVDADNDGKDDSLITMGGFNYGEGVAAKAWLPGISLNYKIDTPQISWLDYALPYIEYSNIIKDENTFNDSYMYMIGTALARGNWYIYTDLALANGNYFVGPYTSSDGGTNNFGANTGNDLEHRLNINFGYYF